MKKFNSPCTDIEIDSEHNTLLREALSDPLVFNIAITGPFGSGKSSLIRSYEKEANGKFAYVSLAEFDFEASSPQPSSQKPAQSQSPSGSDDSRPLNSRTSERRLLTALERSIVNQLMAVNNAKKYKWSSTAFQTEKSFQNTNALSTAFIFYIIVVALSTLFVSQISSLSEPLFPQVALAIFVALFILFFVLVFWYGKSGFPPLIKNISAGSTKIELQNPVDYGSFFDQNLAFVLRVFEARPEETYVFEDLDRLKQDELFVHLRELNAILNNHFKNERKITFIYCLSDNVLKGESRTKFFDVIIPVVPYVNSYNAYTHLMEELGSEKNNLPPRLLKNIALYIDDYRQLSSIVREYNVYKSCLKTPEKNPYRNKLFSLIALKNICPDLFQNLLIKQGSFYEYVAYFKSEQPYNRDDLLSAITHDLKEFYSDIQINKIVSFCDYLLQNRYLEKDYYFYISYEDNDALSFNDRSWLIESRVEKKEIDYTLDNPETVLELFEESDYLNPNLLNLSILDALLNNEDARHLSDIINCSLKHDEKFSIAATERLPLFPAQAIQINNNFFSEIKGLNRTKFVLSILDSTEIDDNKLQTADENNSNFIQKEIQEYAGTYTDKTLSTYSHNTIKALIAAANLFDIFVESLSHNANKTLLLKIAESRRFLTTRENCLVICDCFCDPAYTTSDIFDRMKISNENLLWKFVLEDPDCFINEFFSDDSSPIACSKTTFLELFNREMSQESKTTLLEYYAGKKLDLSEIENTADWSNALDYDVINKSLSNIVLFLEKQDINSPWVNFVNSFKDLNLLEDDIQIEEETLKLVLFQTNLRDDIYKIFTRHASENLFNTIPEQLSTEKIIILFNNNLIELNGATLNKARDILSSEELCAYESKNFEHFIETVKPIPNTIEEEEVLNLLLRLKNSSESINELCKIPFSPISEIEELPNQTIKELLAYKRIAFSEYQEVINRYGQLDCLDTEIEQLIRATSLNDFEQLNLSLELSCKTISQLSLDKQKILIERFINKDIEHLEQLLYSLGDKSISNILKGKHPSINDLGEGAIIVIEILKTANLVSQGSDGKIYRRKWK